ncbi:MAG: response regulator [Faecalibacterium sp.]
MKILIADDERILLDFMKERIETMDLPFDREIFCAQDGKAAYQILCSTPIDLAIVDIVMPEMTGLALIEKSKANPLLYTEFVVCSGYQDFSYAQQAIRFGAFDYMVKPVNEDVLYEMLVHANNKHTGRNDSLSTRGASYSALANKLLEEIEENLECPELSLKWLCQTRLYINEIHAGRVFTKEVGVKFSDYVKNARLQKAVILLEENVNCSITETACVLGYENNPDYFIEIFKKKYQMTPKQYQKFLKQQG